MSFKFPNMILFLIIIKINVELCQIYNLRILQRFKKQDEEVLYFQIDLILVKEEGII